MSPLTDHTMVERIWELEAERDKLHDALDRLLFHVDPSKRPAQIAEDAAREIAQRTLNNTKRPQGRTSANALDLDVVAYLARGLSILSSVARSMIDLGQVKVDRRTLRPGEYVTPCKPGSVIEAHRIQIPTTITQPASDSDG